MSQARPPLRPIRAALLAVRIVSLALLTISPGLLAGEELVTVWADRPIAVDGRLDDWQGRLVPSTDSRLSIGTVNDGDFLYVALSSSDERIARAVFHRGLIVHLRPKGGTDLAVEYPIGTPDPHGGSVHVHGTGAPAAEATPGTPAEPFILYELDSKEGQRFSTANKFEIAMEAKLDDTSLAYELKIPLTRSAAHPYCLDAPPADKIALEIEIPHEKSEAPPPRAAEEAEGGGYSGGGGGGGRHHGGGDAGGMGGGSGFGSGGGGYGGDGGGGGHHAHASGSSGDDRGIGDEKPASLHVKAKFQLAAATK